MVKQSIEERRQALRTKRILSIQFRIVKSRGKGYDKDWHLSTTHDMSFIGLAFLSDIPVQLDDVLELNVVMSGILDIFKGYGKVVRVEKKKTAAFYLVGLKFVKYHPRKKAKKTATHKRTAVNKSLKRKKLTK